MGAKAPKTLDLGGWWCAEQMSFDDLVEPGTPEGAAVSPPAPSGPLPAATSAAPAGGA